jgi:hypothetical protein
LCTVFETVEAIQKKKSVKMLREIDKCVKLKCVFCIYCAGLVHYNEDSFWSYYAIHDQVAFASFLLSMVIVNE